jgi:hypothetical protein
MKLTTLIETMTTKQADMMKELTAILAQHGNVDVYQGDMVPVSADSLDDLFDGKLDVDMVMLPEEPAKYPQGFLHLGQW